MASTTQSAPSSHFAHSSVFLQSPTCTSILHRISTTSAAMRTYCAQGAIFFKNFCVAMTLGVPTSSSVAHACRLSDDRVVRSNCECQCTTSGIPQRTSMIFRCSTPLCRESNARNEIIATYLRSSMRAAQLPTPPHPTMTTQEPRTLAMDSSPKKL